MICLASNELPFAPFAEAVAAGAGVWNLCPDSPATGLERAIAAHVGADPDRVLVGPGSIGALHQLLRAYIAPADEIVYAWRSFEAYPMLVPLYHAVGRPIALTSSLRHDLVAMRAAITDRTRVVIVCNPNNPTGTTVRAETWRSSSMPCHRSA